MALSNAENEFQIMLDALSVKTYKTDYPIVLGVLTDIKDEYKWRVNRAYEMEQILKSGDCYDTPYFTKLIEVVDETGKLVGYTDLYLKNDGENYKLDKVPNKIIVKKVE